jgi:hypothetical protein
MRDPKVWVWGSLSAGWRSKNMADEFGSKDPKMEALASSSLYLQANRKRFPGNNIG